MKYRDEMGNLMWANICSRVNLMQNATDIYRIYSIVSRGLSTIFFTISCGLQSRVACIFSLAHQTSRLRPVFSWLRFIDQNLFSHYLSSLQQHMHIRYRRDYNEQKAVVVVNQHYQGF